MPPFYSLEYKMPQQCSRWSLLKEPSSTGKEQLGCIQLFHMLLDRYRLHLNLNASAEWWDAWWHFLVQVLIELPYSFIQTILYGLIVYAMLGFEWTFVKFFWHLFFMYFTLLYFTFYGMMTVAVTPNHNIAAIVSSAFYALWNLFSGFIVPKTVSPSIHMIAPQLGVK